MSDVSRLMSGCLLLSVLFFGTSVGICDDDATKAAAETSDAAELPEGHSIHGEVFNEGPRQAAYLMSGVGNVHFDVTSSSEDARAFVRQGIGQLHGFWYFESERSFRQAATLDPECAIAYWGMAMSNRKNEKRAKGFLVEADRLKGKASRREKLYIEALKEYFDAKADSEGDKAKRAEKYAERLDDLITEFPGEIEAKAFLCEFMWSGEREGLKVPGHQIVDALLQQILAEDPLHPAHHYRIHWWDNKKAEKALESADRCGLAAPAIAHMWHMPGHIYSKLKRYHDAVYQQEASARVDHAHMMRDLVLPDQIHNFAHNNEWCIRNMNFIGRVTDAVSLAKNMIQLPQHPKYNTISKQGSFKYGHQRLLDVLRNWQLHDQLILLSKTPYLEPCGDEKEDLRRNRYLAAAYAATQQTDQATAIRQQLQDQLTAKKTEQQQAGQKAEQEAREQKKSDKDIAAAKKSAEDGLKGIIADVEKAVQEIDGRLAAAKGDLDAALELFKKAGSVPVEEQVALLSAAGRHDDAVRQIADHVRTHKNELRPLVAQVSVLWTAGKKDEARKIFEQLRSQSSSLDLSVPVVAQLTDIAKEFAAEGDWRSERQIPADIGQRPPLDALGPLRWQPSGAADWSLADVDNRPRTLSEFRGRPVVVIFYLGAGCLHCAEQLQKFAPATAAFREKGFEIIAVSTDAQKVLKNAWTDLEQPLPFPLVSDQELNVFKRYRCYDDFENKPLHGTFVIDAQGRIRWQDISYEPFMDPDFVLKEAVRLLEQDQHSSDPAAVAGF
ncbi:MAG: redoxin domain-containing protein [Planctomycetaceae bacterium]